MKLLLALCGRGLHMFLNAADLKKEILPRHILLRRPLGLPLNPGTLS